MGIQDNLIDLIICTNTEVWNEGVDVDMAWCKHMQLL